MKAMAEKKRNKYFRILEAAARVFAEKGFHKAKISDVARLAGVADGTVYLYFKNKHDLLIKTFEEIMEHVNEMVREICKEDISPEEKIKALINGHYELAKEHPHIVEVITFELRQSYKFMKEYENKKFKEYLRLISLIIKEGQNSEVFPKEINPYIASRAFFGILNETMLQWVVSKEKYSLDEISEVVSRIILKGLTKNQS